MEFITTNRDHELLIVTLGRAKANPLNAAMVEELIAALESATGDDVRGVVLASDRPKFFSSGFDVSEVFQYDRERMTEFFGRFINLYESILLLPKPVVAAVSGHAYAGGAVLALACDSRIMAEGEFGFALNEVNLGVVVPSGFIRMATAAVGARNAREIILEGKPLSPARALEMGLADSVVKPEAVLDRAIARARELAAKPPMAFGAVKRLFLEASGHSAAFSDRLTLSQFVEHWFSPEATERKEALIQSLRR
ncbi:MAG TPA: enoyl-CoA hydratase/isomerase family protein [Blastocatellia bacterium]|nr:enoyl-CoA hydratase/isomerase family protein [Blastocatellia bacterium]